MTGATMRMPALAVVGPDRQVIRSTEAFRRRYEDAAGLCERSPELGLVLTGQTDAAVIELGDVAVEVEAVTDAAGERRAMLTLLVEELSGNPESPLTALREAADGSPAIVWIKDLDGRYLYVNPRFEYALDTVEERLLGHTDAELPPVETVDGPRLRYAEDGLEEPLQLEYTVPVFESRPALVAFRFAVCDQRGEPIATCGVADRSTQAHVARDEAVRLMKVERWNRLDPVDVRAELLEQWDVHSPPGADETETSSLIDSRNDDGVQRAKASVQAELEAASEAPAPPSPMQPDPISDQADAVSEQREDEWVRQLRQAGWMSARPSASETFDALQSDLQLARKWAERTDELRSQLQEAHARIGPAEAEAEAARSEAEAARSEAEAARAEAEAARSELEGARSEAEAARSELEAARSELEAASLEAEAAERERGDELAGTLERVRALLGDLETVFERHQPGE